MLNVCQPILCCTFLRFLSLPLLIISSHVIYAHLNYQTKFVITGLWLSISCCRYKDYEDFIDAMTERSCSNVDVWLVQAVLLFICILNVRASSSIFCE